MESLFVPPKASALHVHRNAVTDGSTAGTVDGTVDGNEALWNPPSSTSQSSTRGKEAWDPSTRGSGPHNLGVQ